MALILPHLNHKGPDGNSSGYSKIVFSAAIGNFLCMLSGILSTSTTIPL